MPEARSAAPSPAWGPTPPPEAGVALRPWQREALDRFESSPEANFLAVATPGAGKTTFALVAARRMLVARTARRVVVVVPTQHLKVQWAGAAEALGLHLDPDWSSSYGTLPSDVHGVAVTYQQVAANPGALRGLVQDALVILDEIHHAGESRSWGDGVRFAFEPARRRLSLSGTPFRSDQSLIPFVRYHGDLAEPDYDYGYGAALGDKMVVRPVFFPRINGQMEWTAPDGSEMSATFDDKLTRDLSGQRLRAALAPEGEWMPAVLTQAHAQLMHLRARDPRAAGLVIAMDQDHARAIAGIMTEKLGVTPTVATSDDPGASRKIGRFAADNDPWIIAVRMVSEGVDIPRLRVGVYATHTVTELFFRQAVGRVVRWTGRLGAQTAYMFIPDDPRLRAFAFGIAEQRRHNLRKREEREDEGFGGQRADEAGPGTPAEGEVEPDGQLSLFSVISAVPLDEQGRPLETTRVYQQADDEPVAPDELAIPDYYANTHDPTAAGAPAEPPTPWLTAVPLPDPLPAPRLQSVASSKGPLARRRELREQNSQAARELVHMTGRSHADVNAELNRRCGIKRVSEATARQLEQRLAAAKRWLEKA